MAACEGQCTRIWRGGGANKGAQAAKGAWGSAHNNHRAEYIGDRLVGKGFSLL